MKRIVTVAVIVLMAGFSMAQDKAPENTGKQLQNKEGQSEHGKSRMMGGRMGEMMGGGMMGGEMIERMLSNPKTTEELGLTEENITALRAELEALKTKTDALAEKMRKAGMKQAELMTAKELDESALMAAVEETGVIQTEMGKLRVQKLLIIRKYVSSDAMQKMQTKFRERMEEMRKRHEGGEGQGDRERTGRQRPTREGGEKTPPPAPPATPVM
jgi:Spy/CpxP family protein refolding chaperone